jgi:hypothetical protein
MTIKCEFSPNQVSYLLELVHTDMHRMRELTEHGKSRGERGLHLGALDTSGQVATVLMTAFRDAIQE